MKIVIDAGHGKNLIGLWTGTRGNGLIEDVVVKEIEIVDNLGLKSEQANGMVDRLGWWLRKAGHETVYTRTGDRACGLVGSTDISHRVKIARNSKADLLISLHCNSVAKTTPRGFEVFAAAGDNRSMAIARRVESAIIKSLGDDIPSRGAKWDTQSAVKKLGILRGLVGVMPAILIEVGFLSNIDDVRLINNRQFRQRFCEAIATAVTAGT